MKALDCVDAKLVGFDLPKVYRETLGEEEESVKAALACKGALEKKISAAPAPQQVSISEDDTWAHNPDIGKSNVCINVRTTPPQASVSGELTGPNGYDAKTNGKQPLHADGTAQIVAPITQPGDYTKTLIVYDASGNQTATVTKTFTVAAPPQDGPATTPPCPKPTQ